LPVLVAAFLIGLIQSTLEIFNLSDKLAAFAVPFLTKQFKLTAQRRCSSWRFWGSTLFRIGVSGTVTLRQRRINPVQLCRVYFV